MEDPINRWLASLTTPARQALSVNDILALRALFTEPGSIERKPHSYPLGPVQKEVLSAMEAGTIHRTRDIRRSVGRKERAVSAALRTLQHRGLITRVSQGRYIKTEKAESEPEAA